MDKIICIGKNYLDHAKELGDAVPERPVLFLKPPSVLRAARTNGERLALRIPPGYEDIHHECEIVLRLSRGGYRLSLADATAAISDVTLGLDMTLRDLQTKLKKQGHPWETSKAFLDSATVGPWVPVAKFPDFTEENFTFSLDGQVKQQGLGREMRFGPGECVAMVSEHFQLVPGDIIFTGTPAGVGPVRAGQIAELSWGNRVRYSVSWTPFSR